MNDTRKLSSKWFLEHNLSWNTFTTITQNNNCDTWYAFNTVKDSGIISFFGLIYEVI